jgi:hypothetical protein
MGLRRRSFALLVFCFDDARIDDARMEGAT